ncbi:MAG: AbrB/MazE/SpoVT family DNA-binding domain-containing protein [Armatimonadota bacterium]
MTPKINLEECFVGTVTIGERGQIVIPAEARKKLGLHPGERLMVIIHPSEEGIALLKIETMREMLNKMTLGLNIVESQLNAGLKDSDINDES